VPGKLCVLELVPCKSRKNLPDCGIDRGIERLACFDRSYRFADASFAKEGCHELLHTEAIQRARDVESRRAHDVSGVGACQSEGEPGVLGFVPHGDLRVAHEIGGRPDGQELNREASECGDGRVLHQADTRPAFGQARSG
jgi:hypothetical protein